MAQTSHVNFYLVDTSWSFLITVLRLLLQAKDFDGPSLPVKGPLLFFTTFGTEVHLLFFKFIFLRIYLNVNWHWPNKVSMDLLYIVLAKDFSYLTRESLYY